MLKISWVITVLATLLYSVFLYQKVYGAFDHSWPWVFFPLIVGLPLAAMVDFIFNKKHSS